MKKLLATLVAMITLSVLSCGQPRYTELEIDKDVPKKVLEYSKEIFYTEINDFSSSRTKTSVTITGLSVWIKEKDSNLRIFPVTSVMMLDKDVVEYSGDKGIVTVYFNKDYSKISRVDISVIDRDEITHKTFLNKTL